MPNFDFFEGIRINIYNGDHWPPHIHVEYGDEEALLVIANGTIYKGWLPVKQLRKALSWLRDNKADADQAFKVLNPHLYAPRKKQAENINREKH
jgi:hypothetical protein